MRTPEQRRKDTEATVNKQQYTEQAPVTYLIVVRNGLCFGNGADSVPTGIFLEMRCGCGCNERQTFAFDPEQVNRIELAIAQARELHPLIFQ